MQSLVKCIVIFTIFKACSSLSCFTCHSKENWTHCDETRERRICEPWLDRCVKAHTSFDMQGRQFEIYEKGCFPNKFCSQEVCKKISGAEECQVECCDLELCNGGPPLNISQLLAGVCAALLLVKFGKMVIGIL